MRSQNNNDTHADMGTVASSPQRRCGNGSKETGRSVERGTSCVRRTQKQANPTSSLIINNRSLSPGDISQQLSHLSETCRQSSDYGLRHFGLVYCYLSPTTSSNLHSVGNMVLSEVINVLKNNPYLESIKLKGPFPRHRDDLVDMLAAMYQLRQLTEISIGAWYWSNLNVPFDHAWIDTVKNNQHTLERLSLDCFDLSNVEISMEHMCQALKHATNLSFLCLRNCHVTDQGFQKLVRMLIEGQDDGTALPQLKTLHLACNTSLTTESLVTLGVLIKQPHIGLESLDLIGNKTCFQDPTDEQLEGFLQGLRVNTSLRRLSLVSCGIVDEIGKHLFEALKTNKTLRRLELDYNEMTRETGMNRHCLGALPDLRLSFLGMCGVRHVEQRSAVQDGATRQPAHVTSSWRCDGSFQTLAFLRKAVSQNKHLLSFHLDCSCCQRHASSFLQRNEIRHTIETQLEPLSTLPTLHTIWMAKCPGNKSSSCLTLRPQQQAQEFADQRRLHNSTIFYCLVRNAHNLHQIIHHRTGRRSRNS